jgi:hypothetical protein
MQLWRQTHVALIEVIEKDERAKTGGRTLFLEKPRFSTGQKPWGKRQGTRGLPSLCQDLTGWQTYCRTLGTHAFNHVFTIGFS